MSLIVSVPALAKEFKTSLTKQQIRSEFREYGLVEGEHYRIKEVKKNAS